MTDLEQTPDEFMDLPCRNCGHDMSVHKTGVGVLGYPCIHTEMRVESVVDTSEAESPFKSTIPATTSVSKCGCAFFMG